VCNKKEFTTGGGGQRPRFTIQNQRAKTHFCGVSTWAFNAWSLSVHSKASANCKFVLSKSSSLGIKGGGKMTGQLYFSDQSKRAKALNAQPGPEVADFLKKETHAVERPTIRPLRNLIVHVQKGALTPSACLVWAI